MNFRNGYAFYKNQVDEYSGKVLFGIGYTTYFITYKDGLKEGLVKVGNEKFLYSKGTLIEYSYIFPNGFELIHLKDELANKNVVSVELGAFFNSQLNDTLYISDTLTEVDSIDLNFGTTLIFANGNKEIIKCLNTSIAKYSASASAGCFHMTRNILGNKIDYLFLSKNNIPNLYIYNIKLFVNGQIIKLECLKLNSYIKCKYI